MGALPGLRPGRWGRAISFRGACRTRAGRRWPNWTPSPLGFQPNTLWPAGQWTADWPALRLPDAAPADGEYPLVMRLYDPAGGRTLLTRRVGVMTWGDGRWTARLHEPSFELPADLSPTTATFGDSGPLIALPGYRLARDGDTLRLTLVWQAAGTPGDFTRFVHLLDAAGNIVTQLDGAPAGQTATPPASGGRARSRPTH